MSMPWFRMYSDIIDDDKIRLLAFEDRWHFVALCSLKCSGLTDNPDDPLLLRKLAVKMGVQLLELDEIKRRLMDVELIDENFVPLKWGKRQYQKPGASNGEPLDGHKGYVYFIASKRPNVVKIGYSKNPWARVKDLQTATAEKLSVVATIKTTEVSEVSVHDIFEDERRSGEWFYYSERLQLVISKIKSKNIQTIGDINDYVATTVATTKDTEADTDTDTDKNSTKVETASGEAVTAQNIFDEFNVVAGKLGLPLARDLNPTRRQLLNHRAKQHSIDDFATVFGNIESSPFLRGDKGSTPCKFDWVFKANNFTKILEGNYND